MRYVSLIALILTGCGIDVSQQCQSGAICAVGNVNNPSTKTSTTTPAAPAKEKPKEEPKKTADANPQARLSKKYTCDATTNTGGQAQMGGIRVKYLAKVYTDGVVTINASVFHPDESQVEDTIKYDNARYESGLVRIYVPIGGYWDLSMGRDGNLDKILTAYYYDASGSLKHWQSWQPTHCIKVMY